MPEKTVHLLLVEDEEPLRVAVAERLAEQGFQVDQAESGERALEQLAEFAYDIVITDLRLPGVDGTHVIEAAIQRYPDIIGLVVTGYGTVRDAVEAIKRGATDFVTKPFQFDELMHALNTALEQRRLRFENAYLRSQLEERYRFEGIVGRSRAMRDLFQLLETVAATSSTILISGETGTGKEVVARAIHHNSPRRAQRFVALNCSAIPETLLEAELFGHVRGAFTGAVGTRQGRLEQANRGTLFLDEVGTMSPALQMKLLRVLQEREFERIGDSHSVKVDVRVIAATNTDLAKMVQQGEFREDLYYRLNVIPIQLPPLRNRKEDIPLLVQHFLQRFAAQRQGGLDPRTPSSESRPSISVSQQAMRRLMAYHWPGNVRQLENAIERAVALSGGRTQIEVTDLPTEVQSASEMPVSQEVALPGDGFDLDAYVGNIERELIYRALEKSAGNKGRAAKLLSLKRTTLVEKLKRLERGN
ncbi:MAG TPA: sigma-54 dependent transcriptional regulator [Vicinamibacterales bacterium]|jgi:DNA-binding NtrC family response regulator